MANYECFPFYFSLEIHLILLQEAINNCWGDQKEGRMSKFDLQEDLWNYREIDHQKDQESQYLHRVNDNH